MSMFRLAKRPTSQIPSMTEVFAFRKQGDGEWDIVPDNGGDPPGFNFFVKNGRNMDGVWAPFLIKRKFESAYTRSGYEAPGNLKPKEIVDAIFGVGEFKGIHVAPGVKEKIIRAAAHRINTEFAGKFDAVVAMASSKSIPLDLAKQIAQISGKIVIEDAVRKQDDPEKVYAFFINHPDLPDETKANVLKNIQSYRKSLGTDKDSATARRKIHVTHRKFVRGLTKPGPGVEGMSGKLPRILIVDDTTSTGMSVNSAATTLGPPAEEKEIGDKLEGLGFPIAGLASIFMME